MGSKRGERKQKSGERHKAVGGRGESDRAEIKQSSGGRREERRTRETAVCDTGCHERLEDGVVCVSASDVRSSD